jgi:alpha-glucosidase (family GH31 glycosyl hydrolase)
MQYDLRLIAHMIIDRYMVMTTEYTLGEDILFAPVLDQWTTSSDIYLPLGEWQDGNDISDVTRSGPICVRNYPAPIRPY